MELFDGLRKKQVIKISLYVHQLESVQPCLEEQPYIEPLKCQRVMSVFTYKIQLNLEFQKQSAMLISS